MTAQHVIEKVFDSGSELFLRVNTSDGGFTLGRLNFEHFYFHPNAENPTDVAVTSFGFDGRDFVRNSMVELNFRSIYLNGSQGWVRPGDWLIKEIGLGGEVCTVGLFRGQHGKERNTPIVRVGNLAALPDNKVVMRGRPDSDAFLVETRSIGGLSGSPVFGFPNPLRLWTQQMLNSDGDAPREGGLIGLLAGHFDAPNHVEDIVPPDAVSSLSVNTGIGVVVPIEKVVETIEQSSLASVRQNSIEQWEAQGHAPPGIDDA